MFSVPGQITTGGADSGANGLSSLSQNSNFGDYIVNAPSWIGSKNSALNDNALLIGIAILGVGILLWKSKK